jgi:uncharacterized iron-regulated membrane protein
VSEGRKGRKLPPAFTAAALDGHSAVGLVFGALIYLVCLTGAISVLVDELKLVEQPAPAAGGAPRPGALDRAVAEVAARVPHASAIYAVAPTTPRQRLTVTAYAPGGEQAYVADAQGAVIRQRTPFADFVTELHMTLTAPAPCGSLAVGVAGCALLSLIISGVLAHPRTFRDAFRLRLAGSVRLREADLHNRLSVWGLPFHVAVTLTGALFGLANLVILAVAAACFHGDAGRVLVPLVGPAIAADARPAPLPDLEALVRRAVGHMPGSALYDVGVQAPGTRGARVSVEVSAPGRLPRGEDFYFDAQGREIGRGRFVTGALGLQAYSAAAQLHFGFFGGLPVRLAYVALGGALSFIAASGVSIWLERRADRGRPAPRIRAAWRGWTFGAPIALLAAALASPFAPPALVFWPVAALAPGAAAVFAPGLWARRGARRSAASSPPDRPA